MVDRKAVIGALLLMSLPISGLGQPAPALTYVQPLTTEATRAIQDRLHQLGSYSGPSDGVWGPGSQTALSQFQSADGLQPTGQLNQATVSMLGLNAGDLLALGQPPQPAPPPPPGASLSPEVVRNIQARLRALGFYPGAIDGIWGPAMQSAVEHFQQSRGLQVTGQLTPVTVSAMGLDPNNLSAPPIRQ
ncbi:MAG: peptidoglycan-binding protein [Acetobacteraceae bacterium]|nr:peptidoglycan-binding protein [Acetobacteraceae bacterium]